MQAECLWGKHLRARFWFDHNEHALSRIYPRTGSQDFLTSGWSVSFLWPLVYMFWATAEVFWRGASTLGGTNGHRLTFFARQIHTHTYISEIFHKGGNRRMETSMDQWHSYPFQYRLLESAFTMWVLLPQSALSTWCAPFLSASCGVAPPPFIWAATTQPAKSHFLFVGHPIFASSDINPLCCTWLNINSPNQGDDKTLPPNTLMAELLLSQKHGGELLVEQTGNETVTGPWMNQEYKYPAIIPWFQHLPSGAFGLPTTITSVDTQLELHCLIYIQTFADTRIPAIFFVSFYLKVEIRADLCAGLLSPVHLSGPLQLQLLLLVLSSQTLLLWQWQSQKKRKKSMLIRMVF